MVKINTKNNKIYVQKNAKLVLHIIKQGTSWRPQVGAPPRAFLEILT